MRGCVFGGRERNKWPSRLAYKLPLSRVTSTLIISKINNNLFECFLYVIII
ncbi:hypothetical protein Hanom_Chr17g01530001 [Helianthus anomalus]